MKHSTISTALLLALFPALLLTGTACTGPEPSSHRELGFISDGDPRLDWWREARFGLFIHWGLYAIPAGEWKGETNHAEWIRHTARIPVEEYDRLVKRFDPVEFDADEWARIAKEAGMKYIVITSKHHDGFCLFDSEETDYDVMSTPFKRDILKELADACRRHGLKICWYHSIMDWHHPDYLPRRGWEKRSAEGARFERYAAHMKKQLEELITDYGPIGVLWFDGEWEGTWTHEQGKELYDYVRSLQPDIIINNRVDKGRAGMEGTTRSGDYAGDFGTPEQRIPATGLPGVDWETCMTMNNHWGYNKNDHNWKPAKDLIRKLVDIASKGGNFLLNVGPTAEGLFPEPCVERLKAIGKWMAVNSESIYGTTAGPFKELEWGRCTARIRKEGMTSLLYLHVFDWPAGGKLVVPGLDNKVRSAQLRSGEEILTKTGSTIFCSKKKRLRYERRNLDVVIELPPAPPDPVDSVIVLEIDGRPVVIDPPRLEALSPIFVDFLDVVLSTEAPGAEIRYTLDKSTPAPASPLYSEPIRLTRSALVSAGLFRDGEPVSGVREAFFEKVPPRPGLRAADAKEGLRYEYFEGDWTVLPDFDRIEPAASGTLETIGLETRRRDEHFGLRFTGFVEVPECAVYRFFIDSDDGSRLFIADELIVDNDGLHGPKEKWGEIALGAGLHPITILFFQRTGGKVLKVSVSGRDLEKKTIPIKSLYR